MLLPYNNTNGNIEVQKQQILTAIVQAKQDGLGNEEIIDNIRETLPDVMVSYAETVLKQIDLGQLRVCEKKETASGTEWITHEWVKKAILLFFKIVNNSDR